MRRALLLTLVAAALAAAGCDTTQPDQVESKTGTLTFSAIATPVQLYDCFELWADTNNDFLPDTDTGQRECDQVADENGNPAKAQRPVPWRYSLLVTKIPAGSTQEQIVGGSIIPGDNIDDFISMTDFDPEVVTGGTKPNQGNIFFLHSKRVSAGSQLYIQTVGFDLGEVPNILGGPPTLDITMKTGDTIVVRARKQPYNDASPFLNAGDGIVPDIQLSGLLKFGGQDVLVKGTATSSTADGGSVYFSFTLR